MTTEVTSLIICELILFVVCPASPGRLLPVTELLPSCISSAITKTPASQDKRQFHFGFQLTLSLFKIVFATTANTCRTASWIRLLIITVYKKKYQAANNIPVYSQMVLSTKSPGNSEPGAVGAAIEQTVEGSWWFQCRVSVSTRENFFLLSSWILKFVHAVCNFCGVLSFFKIIYCFVFSKLDQPRYIPHWPCI